MKKLLFTLLSMLALQASAYDFGVVAKGDVYVGTTLIGTQDLTLYYAVNEDGKTVTVVQGPETYSSPVISIPETVENDGSIYAVTAIGSSAFHGANTNYVVMGNTIEEIREDAFSDCSLKSIEFSKGLKRIGRSAFSGAANLEEAIFPEGLKSIDYSAFGKPTNRGTSLRTVSIPASLETLGNAVFSGCNKLTTVNIPTNCSLTEIPENTFRDCSVQSITLPENLVRIGDAAFSGCKLTSIEFPPSLAEIGHYGLGGNRFTKIVLPSHVKEVGVGAFSGNSYLTDFIFSPEGVTTISNGLFGNCEQLVNVTIPEGITSIQNDAFKNCKLLSSIVLPESVTSIGGGCFSSSGINKITLPSKLQSIQSGTFSQCHNLASIIIPDAVEFIGGSAFAYCENLSSVTMSKNIKQIEGAAFSYSPIESLTLPSCLEKVNQIIFGDKALKEVHMNRNIPLSVRTWGSYYENETQLANDNSVENATLYVPRGSKAAYEASPCWNNFKNIEEEDVDGGIYYQIAVTAQPYGAGSVMVNGSRNDSGKYTVEIDSNVTLTVLPADGWHLQTLTVDGTDVTAGVHDNSYTISEVKSNHTVVSTFAENPVVLKMTTGEGGTIGIIVERGESFACRIDAEEGWKVNTVLFNNIDVTAQVVNDVFTTPALMSDAYLQVSFELNENETTVNAPSTATQKKAYTTTDGILHIQGVRPGEIISVYKTSGELVCCTTASNQHFTFELPNHGVYIVSIAEQQIKLAY